MASLAIVARIGGSVPRPVLRRGFGSDLGDGPCFAGSMAGTATGARRVSHGDTRACRICMARPQADVDTVSSFEADVQRTDRNGSGHGDRIRMDYGGGALCLLGCLAPPQDCRTGVCEWWNGR